MDTSYLSDQAAYRPPAPAPTSIPKTYCRGVRISNWVEDSFGKYNMYTCAKEKPKEQVIDLKDGPQHRKLRGRINMLRGSMGNYKNMNVYYPDMVRNNYSTTNDIVYKHLANKCVIRHYNKFFHNYEPQTDLADKYGNLTSFGLTQVKRYEWQCQATSDYACSSYETEYTRPNIDRYVKPSERKAKNGYGTSYFPDCLLKVHDIMIGL